MKIVYVSEQSEKQLKDYIRKKNYRVFYVSPSDNLQPQVADHPDMSICRLPGEMFFGYDDQLSPDYPKDVLFNCAWVGKYFICSKYADETLLKHAVQFGLTPVVVPQGYVKCNLAIVDEKHVITEDEGIAKVLKDETDIECLLIQSGHVKLNGYNHGFIGGASGRLEDEMLFNGNLAAHPDYQRIKEFVEACGLKLKYFDEYELNDIGSIIGG